MTFSIAHPFRSPAARAEYQALYAKRSKHWPVPFETRLLDTPSGQTFVRVSGPADAPPLVLLPGSRGTSLTWIPNIAALSAQYRTYAVDAIYDFGLSIRRRELRRPADLLAWLEEVLHALSPVRPANLLGLSYGGWLAGQYAVRAPERLHKLVLLDPALTVLPVSPALLMRATLTLIPLAGFRRQFYYWLLQDAVHSGAPGRAYVDETLADWAVAERCFARLPLIPGSVLSDSQWQHLGVPCLVLLGENEKIYSAPAAQRRLQRLGAAIQVELVPGAGHDAWYIQAGRVNQRILDFLGLDSARKGLSQPGDVGS